MISPYVLFFLVAKFLWNIIGKHPFICVLFYYCIFFKTLLPVLLIIILFIGNLGITGTTLNLLSIKTSKKLLSYLEKNKDGFLIAELPEYFKIFIKKRMLLRHKSRKIGKSFNDDYGEDFKILIPKKIKNRVVPPMAFPNHINKSHIIIPNIEFLKNPSNLKKFIVYHELEHCTSFSLKRINQLDRYPYYALFSFSLFLFNVNSIMPVLLVLICFFILKSINNYFKETGYEEAQTDLLALSYITEGREKLIFDLKNHYTRKRKISYGEKKNQVEQRLQSIDFFIQANEVYPENSNSLLKTLGNDNLLFITNLILISFCCFIIIFYMGEKLSLFSIISFSIIAFLSCITTYITGEKRDHLSKHIDSICKEYEEY